MVVHTVLFLEKIFIKNIGTLCPQLPRTVIMSACVFSGGLRLNCQHGSARMQGQVNALENFIPRLLPNLCSCGRACLDRTLSVYLSCAPRRAVGPSLPCSAHGRFRIASLLNARCPSISSRGQPQVCGHQQTTPRIPKPPALAGRARVGYPLPSLRPAHQVSRVNPPAGFMPSGLCRLEQSLYPVSL